MVIKDLIERYKSDLTGLFSLNQEIVDVAEEWSYYSSIPINSPIVTGWFDNDNLLIINVDGLFIYDLKKQKTVFEDYDSKLKPGISNDNLRFYVKEKNIEIDVFGIRGGGGNLLTKDSIWSLGLINLSWNIVAPTITNLRTGKFYFLKLNQLFYEGNIKIGFSKSDNYFAIVGDGGVDIYQRLSS